MNGKLLLTSQVGITSIFGLTNAPAVFQTLINDQLPSCLPHVWWVLLPGLLRRGSEKQMLVTQGRMVALRTGCLCPLLFALRSSTGLMRPLSPAIRGSNGPCLWSSNASGGPRCRVKCGSMLLPARCVLGTKFLVGLPLVSYVPFLYLLALGRTSLWTL